MVIIPFMINRVRNAAPEYPKQFWLMFGGMILSTTGATMIWPFLMIFVSERLSLPLVAGASLMTISAIVGLVSSIAAGPIVDKLGRKPAMVVGLVGTGLGYFLLSWAETYAAFAIILGLNGVFSPLYKVGSDSMLADLIPIGKRADAFALIRMGRNIGVAAGPALGGFVLSQSYDIGLYGAAIGFILFGLLFLFFAHETIPQEVADERSSLIKQLRGYWTALKDRPFMGLVGAFTLVQMTASLVWVLLSVYVKTNYGISERLYGWLPTTNALMVVFLQVLITRRTKGYNPLKVMRWGSVFYIAAPILIAFSTSFWGFWTAMVIMTLGELIIVPPASAYAANLAPIDKRGRYMSLYGLSWNVASGISPLLGGFLGDQFGSQVTWFGGAVFALLSVFALMLMERQPPVIEILD